MATIDLELTDIDINQCDFTEDDAATSLDVFHGTHSCQPTTKVTLREFFVTLQPFNVVRLSCEITALGKTTVVLKSESR